MPISPWLKSHVADLNCSWALEGWQADERHHLVPPDNFNLAQGTTVRDTVGRTQTDTPRPPHQKRGTGEKGDPVSCPQEQPHTPNITPQGGAGGADTNPQSHHHRGGGRDSHPPPLPGGGATIPSPPKEEVGEGGRRGGDRGRANGTLSSEEVFRKHV